MFCRHWFAGGGRPLREKQAKSNVCDGRNKNGARMSYENPADQDRRQGERDGAIAAISRAISTLESSGGQPDLWERQALAEAIGAVFRGAYVLAVVNASIAK